MTNRRQRIATGVRVAGPEVLSFPSEDQQMVLQRVVQGARMAVESHRSAWLKGVEWSERFEEDSFKASKKVLDLWEKAGYPFPIMDMDILPEGTPYQHDGEAFMEFTRSLWFGEDRHKGIEDDY